MQKCMLPKMTLSREKRLRKRRDYLRVQRYGTRSFGRFLVVIAERHKETSGKVGITIPKKVGRAHVRNKIKRRIKHILRTNQELFHEKSLVVVVKESSAGTDFSELSGDLIDACRRLKHGRLFKSSYKNQGKKTLGA
jgi:ribonuclease P protein component